MTENRCKARVLSRELRGMSFQCQNKAGYGENKDYCKIHAREQGYKIGETVRLYQVINDFGGIKLFHEEAETTKKQYRLNGRTKLADYAMVINKDDAEIQGIFEDKQRAIEFFLEQAMSRVESAKALVKKREEELQKAMEFVTKESKP